MFDLVSRERIRTQALDHQSPHVPKINGFSLNCVKMCFKRPVEQVST